MLKFFIITMVNVYITFYSILAGLHLTPFYFCPEYLYFSDSWMWISRSWLWAFKFYVSFIVHEVNIRYICVKLIQINQTMIDWNHNAKLMHISLKVLSHYQNWTITNHNIIHVLGQHSDVPYIFINIHQYLTTNSTLY